LQFASKGEDVVSTRKRLWIIGGLSGAAGFLAACLPSCRVAMPFSGPGYSRSEGVTLPGVGETVVVAVTHAVVDNAKRGPFDEGTRRVDESLPTLDGFIGRSLRIELLGNEAWTMTVWRDEEALESFVSSPAHRLAVREGLPALKSARFLRFAIPTRDVPPSWDDVLHRLEQIEPGVYGVNATEER
jgi:heme-degrading monooxygenase HmoA